MQPYRILPEPPRSLTSRRLVKQLSRAAFLAAIAVLMGGGMGYFAVSWTRDLLDDRAIFATGTPALAGAVEGTERSRKFIFHEYDFTLTYQDQKGERHEVRQEFMTVLGSVDEKTDPEIRYDPTNPSRASTSWSVEVTVSRAVWCAFAIGIAGLGIFLLWAVFKTIRDAFLERTAAREGREIEVRLLEKSRDQYGNVHYGLTVEPTPGDTITATAVLNGASPFWLGEGVALALYSEAHRRVFLVESDGQPVALDDAALADARQRNARPS